MRKWHTTALVVMIAALAVVSPAQSKPWKLGEWSPGIHNVQNAVYYHFCGKRYVRCYYGDQAWNSVVPCETGHTFSVWSKNGQYLGIFQMGTSERATYGHGNNPWAQARAAFKYFSASGFDWSPWDPLCRP